AVGRPRPRPPARLRDQPSLRGLESARDPGPGRRGERRGAEFGPRLRRRRGGDDRADGAVAAGADPGVPRAAVRHAASGRAVPGTSAGVVNGRGEPAWCGPTTHRAVRKVILPPTHRSLERRREPALAARELSVQSASSCNSRSREARPLWVVLTVRFAEG